MPMIDEKETTMASNEEIIRNLYEVASTVWRRAKPISWLAVVSEWTPDVTSAERAAIVEVKTRPRR